MSKLIDLTNNKYGRLTVLYKDTSRKTNSGSYWICQCDCGKIKSIKSSSLRRGEVESCGCLRNEKTAQIKKLQDSVSVNWLCKSGVNAKVPEGNCTGSASAIAATLQK